MSANEPTTVERTVQIPPGDGELPQDVYELAIKNYSARVTISRYETAQGNPISHIDFVAGPDELIDDVRHRAALLMLGLARQVVQSGTCSDPECACKQPVTVTLP